MRGTLKVDTAQNVTAGITPAYAGNTRTKSGSIFCTRDHPRVCGEHFVIQPLAIVLFRITPAYAGNTTGARQSAWRTRDHPRVCGEHRHTHDAGEQSRGSPPRMRGTQQFTFHKLFFAGITPAYAGNTCIKA